MLGSLNVKMKQRFEKDALKSVERFKSYVQSKVGKKDVPAWVSQKAEPETKAQVQLYILR